MDRIHQPFTIVVRSHRGKPPRTATVRHDSETFDVEFEDIRLSLINNGDNSWSAVENLMDQETVNEIGSAIEAHYSKLHPS